MMNQYGEDQFQRFAKAHPAARGGRRRRAARAAMAYGLKHRHTFPNRDAFEAAVKRYLESGQEAEDPECGVFIVSFVIGPIVAFLITRLCQWIWDRCRGLSDQQMEEWRPHGSSS